MLIDVKTQRTLFTIHNENVKVFPSSFGGDGSFLVLEHQKTIDGEKIGSEVSLISCSSRSSSQARKAMTLSEVLMWQNGMKQLEQRYSNPRPFYKLREILMVARGGFFPEAGRYQPETDQECSLF